MKVLKSRVCTAALALLTMLPPAVQSAGAATPQEIDNAIEKGKKYLYSQQHDNNWEGAWEAFEGIGGAASAQGGTTALVTWALLETGEKRTDPRITRAVDAIINDKNPSINAYSVGARTQMYAALPQQDRVQKAMRRDREILLRTMHTQQNIRGFYGYPHRDATHWDVSISQFGVLGMWAIDDVGIEVPNNYWSIVDRAWRGIQRADGGWQYLPTGNPTEQAETLSMTSAGVATLFLINDFRATEGNGEDKNIAKGIEFIEKNFDQVTNPQSQTFAMGYWMGYTLWGVERVGLASGYKYFGKLDWYNAGADLLIRLQRPDGSWDGRTGPVTNTAFAVLFLERGRAPLLVNKMQYSNVGRDGKPVDTHWNFRPRDVANVTRWLGRQLERELRFQILPIDRDVREWHDAPIVYFAGDDELKLTPEQEAKVKQYVEEGGLVVGHADGGNRKFSASFKALGSRLFPIYEFRTLPEDHAIFNSPLFPSAKWRTKPQLQGMSNGSRELMVLLPETDPAKLWQTRNFKTRPELSELMADLMIYPVEITNLPKRGDTNLVDANPNATADRTIRVARLQYDGNWDPEPYGWKRLGAVMLNDKQTRLDVATVKIGDNKLAGFDVAHMTGTSAFRLQPSQQEELKKFVENGGTLIIDAAGGAVPFSSSAQEMLTKIYGDKAAGLNQPLPTDSPLWDAGGDKMTNWDYRRAVREKGVSVIGPKLAGIDVNGDQKIDILFSAEDLSSGMVGIDTAGIFGYAPASATAVMEHVLNYAVNK